MRGRRIVTAGHWGVNPTDRPFETMPGTDPKNFGDLGGSRSPKSPISRSHLRQHPASSRFSVAAFGGLC